MFPQPGNEMSVIINVPDCRKNRAISFSGMESDMALRYKIMGYSTFCSVYADKPVVLRPQSYFLGIVHSMTAVAAFHTLNERLRVVSL